MNLKSGTTGWAVLAAYVLAWDYGVAGRKGGETLSSGFLRAARHPNGRWPLMIIWAATTLHLFGALPKKIDPFHLIAGAAKMTTDG